MRVTIGSTSVSDRKDKEVDGEVGGRLPRHLSAKTAVAKKRGRFPEFESESDMPTILTRSQVESSEGASVYDIPP